MRIFVLLYRSVFVPWNATDTSNALVPTRGAWNMQGDIYLFILKPALACNEDHGLDESPAIHLSPEEFRGFLVPEIHKGVDSEVEANHFLVW